MKIQTMTEKSQNIVSPSVTLFEKKTQVEKAGFVLYICKCAKMVATTTKLFVCTEEARVLVEVQIFSSHRYMDPITKILHDQNTFAACNTLYPNVDKLEDNSFQQNGETLKNFNREIYQWSIVT